MTRLLCWTQGCWNSNTDSCVGGSNEGNKEHKGNWMLLPSSTRQRHISKKYSLPYKNTRKEMLDDNGLVVLKTLAGLRTVENHISQILLYMKSSHVSNL